MPPEGSGGCTGILETEKMTIFKQVWADDSGATAIEYGLIAALIAVAIMTTVGGMGSQVRTSFGKTSSVLSVANS